MSVGYRGGSALEVVSIRCHAIVDGSAAPALVVMKMRPKLVAAQTTFRSDAAGPIVETRPPERSSPHGYGAGQGTVQAAVGVPAGGHSPVRPHVGRAGGARWPTGFPASQAAHGRAHAPV